MDLAVQGDSARDSEELLETFEAWASAGPPGGVRVRSDGDVARVSACDPRRGAEPSWLAVDALTLPTVRAQVMLAAGGGASDIDEAFGVADCFVRAVPLDQLVQANESPEPPAKVMATIERAVADCSVE